MTLLLHCVFFSMLNMKVKVKKFSSYARIPLKATLGSACSNLYSPRFVLLEPGKTKRIETDIGFKFSSKFACRIYPHSSMSLKGIILGGGVTDADFRGSISMTLTNTSDRLVEIEVGDRIAQVFFLRKEYVKFDEVEELDHSEQGENGFGSTGR